MTPVDNSEAYETISWILDNADRGFFLVTAPAPMQRKIAALYKTSRAEVFDFSLIAESYSSSLLTAWAHANPEAEVLFVLNMQAALSDEKDMQSFNMSRETLAKERRIWLFFMTEDMDARLSVFAFDIYSRIMLKARFQAEEGNGGDAAQRTAPADRAYNIADIRDAIKRQARLEKQLMALSMEDTPRDQLLSSALTLTAIAKLYTDCADYEKALLLLERVRGIREQALGDRHPDTAAAYNDVGDVYARQGEYVKALEMFQKASAVNERALGAEHPETATTYSNIAGAYFRQGEYGKALAWYEKALAITEKVLGKGHPDTATAYNNIALVYFHQGDYGKALALYEKALAIT